MNKSRKPVSKPAFKMEKGDIFYKIIVSNPVLFELSPHTNTIITFIVICRATGTFSIVNVMKTAQRGIGISRSLQNKNGVSAKNIDKEIDRIQKDFTQGVRAKTNCKIEWAVLNLSRITDKTEQLERIKKWGKLKVC